MYKSRVFSFNEENLLKDIANYENYGGYEVTELQCNIKTYQVWLVYTDLNYLIQLKLKKLEMVLWQDIKAFQL